MTLTGRPEVTRDPDHRGDLEHADPVVYDADAVAVIRRVPPMLHPLAHRSGAVMLGQLIDADRAWSSMTDRQRELVAAACRPVFAAATDDDPLTPPELADVGYRTRRSLEAKGLLDREGRLTPRALLAAWHGPALRRRRRGVDTGEEL